VVKQLSEYDSSYCVDSSIIDISIGDTFRMEYRSRYQ